MTRRLEAGPLLVTLGALLLLVSLFLEWYTGELDAWEAFEAWDVVLFLLALGSIAAGLGLALPDVDVIDRRWVPVAVAAVALIVASQIINPPPTAAGQEPDTGAWLALGAALLMCAGAVLTFGRVHLALTVEGRDPRQHVSAVDARAPQEPTTESHAVVPPAAAGEPSGSLFGRSGDAGDGEGDDGVGAREAGATEPQPSAEGERPPGEKQV